MLFNEDQISSLAPNAAAFSAGKKLASKSNWILFQKSDKAMWGEIKGSGSTPYKTQIDTLNLAYKCSCPSRQFPCKHGIGLLILNANFSSDFQDAEEPDWVKAWIDKRNEKAEAVASKPEPKELAPEQIERSEKNKEKTQIQRKKSVDEGVKELELWIKDIIRLGLLELPNKSNEDFKRVMSRMVDAKASGLAGWVRSLSELNYFDMEKWHDDSLSIIAKLYLLIKTYQKSESLNPEQEYSIKNLIGWSQSPKELLESDEALTIKDNWLIAYQSNEEIDDLVVQKNYLLGANSGKNALIINFISRFAPLLTPILPGSSIEAELAFFPGIFPQRAVIKQQRRILEQTPALSKVFENLIDADLQRVELLKLNPWVRDEVFVLKNARLINHENALTLLDNEGNAVKIHEKFTRNKYMNWMIYTNNTQKDMIFLWENDQVIPLGILSDSYTIL